MSERRKTPRKSMAMDVALYYGGLGMLRGVTRDISMNGMFIETGPIKLPVNVPVDIVFGVGDGKQSAQHRLSAMIVRSVETGVGAMFRNMESGGEQALQYLMAPPAAQAAQ